MSNIDWLAAFGLSGYTHILAACLKAVADNKKARP